MVAKMQILGELGERVVLLPTLIEEGLAANDRLKIRLSLLQEAASQACSCSAKFQQSHAKAPSDRRS